MTRKPILLVATILLCVAAGAQDSPRWIRHSSISADGQTIAFAWQGDIFTVSAGGGAALQITSNPAYDSDPLWTPDGKELIFSSYRELSQDIWAVGAQGGAPRRLTTYNGNELPLAVHDGYVYWLANIQADASFHDFPMSRAGQIWRSPLAAGKAEHFSDICAKALSFNAEGAYLCEDYKGYEDELRKHHTSSVTRDVWLCKDGVYDKLSVYEGENRNPVFAADGDTFWYLSEEGGNFNVWRSSLSDPRTRTQVTFLPTHPVRGLSASADGTLLFSFNGDLYTCREGAEPRKVEITVTKDNIERDAILRNVSSGATSIAVSPNGKEVAFVAHGDVYVTSTEYQTTRRITDTPSQERGVSFSDDGRALYYAAERNGHWGIYRTVLTAKDDEYFSYCFGTKEEQFSDGNETCFQPQVSPDGEWVAFLRDRTDLCIKSAKGGKTKCLLKGVNYSYSDGDQSFEWSPDSHYLLCTYMEGGRWNNVDVALVDIDDGTVTDLTQSGYSDGNFRWALKGKAMIWQSDKQGYRSHGSWGTEDDSYIMFFDAAAYHEFTRPAEEDEMHKLLNPKDTVKAKKPEKIRKLKLDLDNREDRIVRLTSASGHMGSHYLTDDGAKFYYTSRGQKGTDLMCLDVKKRDLSVLCEGVRSFTVSPDGKCFYTLGTGGIRKIEIPSGKSTPVSFKSEYEYRPAAEREYIFEHCWKQVSEKFYDSAIHGLDWKAMHDNYASFLPFITNNFDFQELLSEMLGELNGSHTGGRYYYRSGLDTGHIGVLFDQNWTGKGLRIAEVLIDGPLNVAFADAAPGDVITAIDGQELGSVQWFEALSMKAGKRLQLSVKHGAKTEQVLVTATASDQDLLYRRWVREREKMTERLSGGRVGYVHVQGMDSESFREVFSKALGKYKNCEALIVDTRHNGGGWLHDDLAMFLSGKKYIEWRPRGQYIGDEPFTRWTKPSCVLTGEDNYSDASGFPYAYRTLGLGKLIGTAVPGTMTAVWWETQIDATLVFGIPQVTGWALKEDRPLENMQIEPDIEVHNTPESLLVGRDLQLEAAVQEMLAAGGER